MAGNAIKELQNALDLGLGIVSRVWDYKTKDWVSSVFVTDVDDDGEAEVIACSRDGRMHVISSRAGDRRWMRIIGTKAWVGAVVASNFSSVEGAVSTRIIAGTRDGKVFVLDEGGETLSKGDETFFYETDGRDFDQERQKKAYWYEAQY